MEQQAISTFPRSSMKNPSSFQEFVHFRELIWPPRFYSCSFCRREFSSSQALGGHMNVHRWDRAKLKQQYSPTSPTDQSSHIQKDSAMFFRENLTDLQMFPSFVPADDQEIQKPLFKNSKLVYGTAVSCERVKKTCHNLPFLQRKLFKNCKKSGSIEDVDLELRL